jgi:hypothetical protein
VGAGLQAGVRRERVTCNPMRADRERFRARWITNAFSGAVRSACACLRVQACAGVRQRVRSCVPARVSMQALPARTLTLVCACHRACARHGRRGSGLCVRGRGQEVRGAGAHAGISETSLRLRAEANGAPAVSPIGLAVAGGGESSCAAASTGRHGHPCVRARARMCVRARLYCACGPTRTFWCASSSARHPCVDRHHSHLCASKGSCVACDVHLRIRTRPRHAARTRVTATRCSCVQARRRALTRSARAGASATPLGCTPATRGRPRAAPAGRT